MTDYSLIGRQYSRVCGRLIGYQIGSPDAFNIGSETRPIREVIIFDGISITYGAQQNHIWSYLAGRQEMGGNPLFQCPCSNENAPTPPQFIGDNYYCESGNPTDSADDNHMILCGMGSSVKVPAAMVPTLPHGSVYSFLLQRLI